MSYPFSSTKKELCSMIKGSDNRIYICIKKRGYLCWEPLDNLSASNWFKYRSIISENMSKLLNVEENKQEEIKKSSKMVVDKTKDLFYKIYKNLSFDDKKLFLKNNKTSWLAKESCPVCLNKSATKHKCIHNDCSGMCKDCSTHMLDSDGKCKSCCRNQLLECPICYDENPIENMCKSHTCNHYVCWACYGKAYHCGNPIESCPSCRADFVQISEYDSSDYDSDMDLEDDMWEDIDVETIQAIEQNLLENNPDTTSEDIIDAINVIINTPLNEISPNAVVVHV